MHDKLEEIHNMIIDGQGRVVVHLINEYGHYDFWEDFRGYLASRYTDQAAAFYMYSDVAITYHRITNR